eukprot:SAG22_NODE_2419_length_2594_cov_2.266934_2_plen_319_part_00
MDKAEQDEHDEHMVLIIADMKMDTHKKWQAGLANLSLGGGSPPGSLLTEGQVSEIFKHASGGEAAAAAGLSPDKIAAALPPPQTDDSGATGIDPAEAEAALFAMLHPGLATLHQEFRPQPTGAKDVLLAGLRSGKLEEAVAKMEGGTASQPGPGAPEPAAAAAPSPSSTDVAASKKKTRAALLGGLRSGKLEAAVAKMEADHAAATDTVGSGTAPELAEVKALREQVLQVYPQSAKAPATVAGSTAQGTAGEEAALLSSNDGGGGAGGDVEDPSGILRMQTQAKEDSKQKGRVFFVIPCLILLVVTGGIVAVAATMMG